MERYHVQGAHFKKKNHSHNIILTIFCNYISEVIRSIETYNVCDGEEVVDEEQV